MKYEVSLDYKSLDKLYSDIITYQYNLKQKNEEFAEKLAELGRGDAQAAFGPGVVVTKERIDDAHYAITANGERVCFLEFGTGVYVDTHHPYRMKVPFGVYPGSWSEDHMRTYQEWEANGRQGEYRYNMSPRRGMLEAYNRMVDYAKTIAEEVFA